MAIHWTKAIGTCAALCLATAGTALVQLNNADGFTWQGAMADFPRWLNTAPNPWLLINTTIAAFTGMLGAWAAVAQLRAPTAYTQTQGEHDRQHQNDSFRAVDDRAEARHREMMAGIASLRETLEANPGVAATTVESAIRTVTELAASGSEADLAIAETAVGNTPIAAADALMQAMRDDKSRAAERARQAASLYAPYAPEKAMQAYREATELDPQHVWSWIYLGQLRVQYGSLTDARTCFGAALQRVNDERDRKVLHDEFGNILFFEGNLGEARSEFEASKAIAERLAATDPDNAEWQRDLSVSHNKLGDVAMAAGDLATARAAYGESLAIREHLVASDPGNAGWQRDLSVSHGRLGDVEVASGHLAEARAAFGENLAIFERLAASNPDNATSQRDLSVNHNRLGDVAMAAGDPAAARVAYTEGFVIAKRLATADPGNAEWQHDLSISQDKLGDVALASGDLTAARVAYAEGLAIRKRLAASDPGNATWQFDLSVSHERLGDVARDSGDLSAARAAHADGLAIRERLAILDPGNARWQRDLSVSHEKLGDVAETAGDLAGAVRCYEASASVAAALAERWPDHPGFVSELATLEKQLAALRAQLRGD